MLSVVDTLKETFFLWARNFWYLIALTLVLKTPGILFIEAYNIPAHSHPPAPVLAFVLFGFLGTFVLDAAHSAGVLGLLRRQALGKTAGATVWDSVKSYTWTLFRLNILIGFIACLLVGALALTLKTLGVGQLGLLMLTGFYLVFIKYALADPLVVVENLMARPALQRSWEMTKGHFWYVAGCYLVLGLAEGAIHRLFPFPPRGHGVDFVGTFVRWGLEMIASAWIILSWCMYLRIKEVDAPTLSEPAAN